MSAHASSTHATAAQPILCANPHEQYRAHKAGIDAAIARVLGGGVPEAFSTGLANSDIGV